MVEYFNMEKESDLRSCPVCRALVKGEGRQCPYCGAVLPAGGAVARKWRRVSAWLNKPNILTHSLFAVIIAAFCVQQAAHMAGAQMSDLRLGMDNHLFTLTGEWWRLVTACFLHGGFLHIAFNSIALLQLGKIAEQFWGPRRMLVGYLLTGIAGNIASCAWYVYILKQPTNSLGASGAICGLLGMLIGMTFRPRIHLPAAAASQLKRWAVFIIVFGILVGADNAAHVGGLLSGMAFGRFVPPVAWGEAPGWSRRAWTGGMVASVLAILLSFAMAGVYFAGGEERVGKSIERVYTSSYGHFLRPGSQKAPASKTSPGKLVRPE